MQRTIFSTPIVNSLLRAFSLLFLKLAGWKVLGTLPAQASKSVFIAAPHTSNWDLPYTLMVAFVLRLNINWMGKASIFRFPFGPLMRWLGGVAVDRSKANNLVAASAQAIREANGALQLTVLPNALLENWFLSHRRDGSGTDRDGLHGLRAQDQRFGSDVCANR